MISVPLSALADGSGSSTPPISVDAGVAPDAASPAPAPQTLPDAESLAQSFFKAITGKDWFMLAGVAIAGLTSLSLWLLAKKWPTWEQSHYKVFMAAGFSGLTALSLAWLADEPAIGSHTLMGAVKLFAAATFAYVVPKKIVQGITSSGPSGS
jgi:hypothetical protein